MGRGGVGEMSILRSNGNNWGRWAAYRIALMYSLTVHFCTVDNNLAIWQSDNPTIWQGSPWSSFVSADSITNSVNKFSDFKTCSAELKRLQQLSREKWFCQLQKVSPVWSGHSNFKNKDYHSHWCFSKVMEAPHTNLCPAQRTLYTEQGGAGVLKPSPTPLAHFICMVISCWIYIQLDRKVSNVQQDFNHLLLAAFFLAWPGSPSLNLPVVLLVTLLLADVCQYWPIKKTTKTHVCHLLQGVLWLITVTHCLYSCRQVLKLLHFLLMSNLASPLDLPPVGLGPVSFARSINSWVCKKTFPNKTYKDSPHLFKNPLFRCSYRVVQGMRCVVDISCL